MSMNVNTSECVSERKLFIKNPQRFGGGLVQTFFVKPQIREGARLKIPSET